MGRLLLDVDLRLVRDSLSVLVRNMGSVSSKGYVNSGRLSEIPELGEYLKSYVVSKKLGEISPEVIEKMDPKHVLDIIDSDLTIGEKNVLLP